MTPEKDRLVGAIAMIDCYSEIHKISKIEGAAIAIADLEAEIEKLKLDVARAEMLRTDNAMERFVAKITKLKEGASLTDTLFLDMMLATAEACGAKEKYTSPSRHKSPQPGGFNK